jgi:hypothetical protein
MLKKTTAALLLATSFSIATAATVFAADSSQPNQIPGYDHNGGKVAVPNPDRS